MRQVRYVDHETVCWRHRQGFTHRVPPGVAPERIGAWGWCHAGLAQAAAGTDEVHASL
ncbi:hypothetical protein ACQUFY_13105 [Robbsia andropogonis]|uniref:hypothetical protein n=1 Tax=Robbsia andropogonis TaxID=28092 RepID=UPI0004B2FA1E